MFLSWCHCQQRPESVPHPTTEDDCVLGQEESGTGSLTSQCGTNCFHLIFISHIYYETLPLKKKKKKVALFAYANYSNSRTQPPHIVWPRIQVQFQTLESGARGPPFLSRSTPANLATPLY